MFDRLRYVTMAFAETKGLFRNDKLCLESQPTRLPSTQHQTDGNIRPQHGPLAQPQSDATSHGRGYEDLGRELRHLH